MTRSLTVLAGLCLLVVVLRVSWSGVRELRRAQAFEQAGELHEAAIRYGRAIHMYLPGNPVPGKAARALLALGERHEGAGDALEARFCYEELRSGFLSVRSAWQPGRRWIEQAEARLVPLMLADQRGNWPARELPDEQRRAELQAVLDAREDPALGWVLVMGLGYMAWLGGAATALWRGLSEQDGLPVRWQPIRRWGAVSAAGYGLWLLGVALA